MRWRAQRGVVPRQQFDSCCLNEIGRFFLSQAPDHTARATFFTPMRASSYHFELAQASSVIVMVGRKLLTQYVFPQPPRRSSVASATTLALGRGRTTCARFLRWIRRAIPDFVASSPAVSELYWGEKCLHVCPKIANLAPRLGRSTLLLLVLDLVELNRE